MTIHYNVDLSNGSLDGASVLDLTPATNDVAFAVPPADERSLLYTIQGGFGRIRPRQDIHLAEVALGAAGRPLDIIQRATASKGIRQGVPAIDDFILTHFELQLPDANAATVRVVNNVTGILYEDLSGLLVPVGGNGWVLRVARIIPTGHEIKISHPTSPASFEISASFEPLDGPDALATLFTGGGIIDLPPVVGEAHTLDPLGVPINKTVPPVALPGGGPASYLVNLNTLRFNGLGSLALRTVLDQPPVGTLSINGWTYLAQSGLDMDVVQVDFDTSAHVGSDVYELVFTNDEGGQAAIVIGGLVT